MSMKFKATISELPGMAKHVIWDIAVVVAHSSNSSTGPNPRMNRKGCRKWTIFKIPKLALSNILDHRLWEAF